MRRVTVVVEPLSGVKPILANADDMRAATIDRAFEARWCDCQTHTFLPGCSFLLELPGVRPTGLPFPCAWKLEWPPARAANLPAKASKAPRRCSAPPDDARHRC